MLTSCQTATPAPSPPVASNPCHVQGRVYCALNPDVTPTTISTTICSVGWTATIRPPSAYTSQLKLKQMAAEHLSGPASAYEEDHRLPLELGGAPSDPLNLSPEPHPQSFVKDAEENRAKARVCTGADLRQVQAQLVAKWLAVYPRYKE